MTAPVLLLITNSYDTTADLLIARLGSDRVFRFNFDLWSDYGAEITQGGFLLASPTGRTVASGDVVKALWRKPRSQTWFDAISKSDEDRYYDQEFWYALREIVNLLWMDGKIVLVEPFAEARAGKFVQMRVAARHFTVPPFQFRRRVPSAFSDRDTVVVKSLTMEPVGPQHERELVFTTRAVDSELSTDCPWMVQRYVHAEKDVTVAFVRDRVFAFELDRSIFRDRTADWREVPNDWGPDHWVPHRLPDGMARRISAFMAELGLHFGRLDFLWEPNDYHFLEVNSNGEWGWLDATGEHGLLGAVLHELDPDTARHSIPYLRPTLSPGKREASFSLPTTRAV